MTLREVLAEMQRRGNPVSARQVHCYILDGTLTQPQKNGAGHYEYCWGHIEELERRLGQKETNGCP